MARKAQFVRPEPGFSLYEGRTRGKRPRYTYSDEEDGGSDALSTRRSNRQSGISTPAESIGPTFTASGRQVRSRHGGTYGEATSSGKQVATQHSRTGGLDGAEDDEIEDEDEPVSRGRPRRAAQQNKVKAKSLTANHTKGYDSLGSMDDESDATSSGNEWDGGDEDEPDEHVDDEEEDEDIDMSDISGAEEEEEEVDDVQQSLVVSLRYKKGIPPPPSQDLRNGPAISEDHSIPPMTISGSKGLSETAYSIDGLAKSSSNAPSPQRDATPTHDSRPTQHSIPTKQATSTQYAATKEPRPYIGQAAQSTPNAPDKDHNPIRSNHSQPEEHPSLAASWPRPETGVVAPDHSQIS